jgi:hypothetical protein
MDRNSLIAEALSAEFPSLHRNLRNIIEGKVSTEPNSTEPWNCSCCTYLNRVLMFLFSLPRPSYNLFMN